MALNNPKSGAFNGNEYQSPGVPWVTGSNVSTSPSRLDFPKVTRGITVRNHDNFALLYVGFTRNGVTGSNRFAIPPGESDRFEIRTKVLWLQTESSTANCSVMAELTLIDASMFPLLTGSTSEDTNAGSGWEGVG